MSPNFEVSLIADLAGRFIPTFFAKSAKSFCTVTAIMLCSSPADSDTCCVAGSVDTEQALNSQFFAGSLDTKLPSGHCCTSAAHITPDLSDDGRVAGVSAFFTHFPNPAFSSFKVWHSSQSSLDVPF